MAKILKCVIKFKKSDKIPIGQKIKIKKYPQNIHIDMVGFAAQLHY